MTGKELANLVRDGVYPVVTFGADIDGQESYLEKGMRGRLVSTKGEDDDTVAVVVDLNEFEAFNQPMESSNYYDKNGVACLTARQAGKYKPQEKVWLSASDDVDSVLKIEESASLALYQRFLATGEGANYVQWLESLVAQLEASKDATTV